MKHAFRTFNATIIGILLSLTGIRFDKSWRHAETGFKAFIYQNVISTIHANHTADDILSNHRRFKINRYKPEAFDTLIELRVPYGWDKVEG